MGVARHRPARLLWGGLPPRVPVHRLAGRRTVEFPRQVPRQHFVIDFPALSRDQPRNLLHRSVRTELRHGTRYAAEQWLSYGGLHRIDDAASRRLEVVLLPEPTGELRMQRLGDET